MRQTFFLAACALCLAACESVSLDELTAKEVAEVQFSVATEIDVERFTRAGIGNDAVTTLTIIDRCGGTTAKTDKASTATDFANPILSLDYGTHELTFIAHKDAGMAYNETAHKLAFSGVNENLFIKTISLTVDKSTTSQEVSLPRKVAQLRVKILDAIPDGMQKMTVKFSNYYREYSITSGFGITSTVETKEYTGWTAGAVNEEVSANTFVPSTDFKTDITITFLGAGDAVIRQVTQSAVPLYENRKTTVSGHFFTHTDGFSVSVDNSWGEAVDVEWEETLRE